MIGPRVGRRGHRIATSTMAVVAAVVVAAASSSAMDGRAYPVGYGAAAVDPGSDPWMVVTDAMVAPLLTPEQRRVRRVRRVVLDYDADGIPDEAVMVRNRTQMGVLVRIGSNGRAVLAYRADGRWSDQSLRRIGGGSIGIEFPESTIVVLSFEGGRPVVRFPYDDDP